MAANATLATTLGWFLGSISLTGANSTANLNGTLSVNATATPPVGEHFLLLSAPNRQGNFATLMGLQLPGGNDSHEASLDDLTRYELVVVDD
jgi:hypothetical protein